MGGGYSQPANLRTRHYDSFVGQLPSMQGKIICITGCTTGMGFILAETFALKGGAVVMLNRVSDRATAALEKLKTSFPSCIIHLVECDLMNFESVRKASKEIEIIFPNGIDILCNNAGIMAFPDVATEDGYNNQIQTNHLSHFLLTKELFPLLQKKANSDGEARIVNHSSISAWTPKTRLTSKYFEKKGGQLGDATKCTPFSGPRWEIYHQTKLANMVFTMALAEKLKEQGSKIKAVVAHPGVAATDLQVTTVAEGGMGKLFTPPFVKHLGHSGKDGALGIIKCCMAPDVEQGDYFGPKGMKGMAQKLTPKPLCTNPEDHKMLWELSEQAIGESFTCTESDVQVASAT
mmetsp:Transcript_12023/g.15599  ORF Transcript_12023/g.15599 Transcript_12023/m.15599 type:complete len:348 (+) Transcript_12023:167-1210(+)